MRYSTTINNKFSLDYGLDIKQAYLFAWFYELPSWAESVIINGDTYFFASKTKAVSELPLLTKKVDTMYRYYKQIEKLKLIDLKKIDGKDYVKILNNQWNEWKSDYSDKNPNQLGKTSENNSDKNPTYNNIILDNNINNNIENIKNVFVEDFEIIKPNQTLIITQIEKKEKSSAEKEKEYDYAVKTCFDVCLNYFPQHLHPKNKNNWLDTIEKLNRIDNIPFETITSITQWARNDNFWKSNFLSLTKLRKNNRDGIKYIIAFNEKMKNEQNNRNNTNKDHVSRMQNANNLVDDFFSKQE